jgi:DNA repair protein RecO (recombination protein O)
MIQKTSGIVLFTQKYSESKLIVKIFTKNFGVQTYIINGSRSKKSKTKATLFQPLSLIDMEVLHSEKGGLQKLSEINNHLPFLSIPFDIIKSSVVLFLQEVLNKSIKESHPDEDLFEFIKNAILFLDLRMENCSNFHIVFMLELSKFLGFYPHGKFIDKTSLFDLQEGLFINHLPKHIHFIDARQSELLNLFLNEGFATMHLIKMNKTERKQLLQSVLLFYKLHIVGFGDIKSMEVLEEVIS